MNCGQARERWHECFDEGTQNADLADHLRSCASCQQYVTEMESITSALDELRVDTESIVSVTTNGPAISKTIPLGLVWYRRVGAVLRVAAVVALVVIAGAYVRNLTYKKADSGAGRPGVLQGPPVVRPVSFKLQGESVDRYLTVRQPATNEEPVEVIWLYPSGKRAAGDDASEQDEYPDKEINS
jgi:hypothetical protein